MTTNKNWWRHRGLTTCCSGTITKGRFRLVCQRTADFTLPEVISCLVSVIMPYWNSVLIQLSCPNNNLPWFSYQSPFKSCLDPVLTAQLYHTAFKPCLNYHALLKTCIDPVLKIQLFTCSNNKSENVSVLRTHCYHVIYTHKNSFHTSTILFIYLPRWEYSFILYKTCLQVQLSISISIHYLYLYISHFESTALSCNIPTCFHPILCV